MTYTNDQQYWIWLASVAGLGPKRFDALLEHIGPPQLIWEECDPRMEPLIGRAVFSALRAARNPAYFDHLFTEMQRLGIAAVTRQDAEYPVRLRAIVDAPPVLFVRGRMSLEDSRTIAIVGSRNGSEYGRRMAYRIARDLALRGITVVSGLALGVDGAAHRGAVDAKARTVAVLGSGVDIIYPYQHLMLSEEIIANGGSIISEFQPGTVPHGGHFPVRNRIISGMCEGILLVEGAKRSGTMSTINFALEQGREVFALPGQADSIVSEATHTLIRDGARLVTSAADICEDMGWVPRKQEAAPEQATPAPAMTLEELQIYNLLAGGPVDTDSLVEELGLSPAEVNARLTVMELQGLIRILPGRKAERLAGSD